MGFEPKNYMNWIILSLLMFLSSVALYLAIRKSSLLKAPTQINNLAMFAIPLIIYSIIGIGTKLNYTISFLQGIIIFVVAVFFSYLGNVFSLKSIEYAPNPGYSLVLSKSYVVFTTLVAVFLFHGLLSIQKAIAIILIIGFSALIMIAPNNVKKVSNSKWLPLAFGAFFCWGMLSLTSKYLFSQGMNTFVFLTYAYIVVTLCIVGEIRQKKVSLETIKKNFWIFLLIGIASTSFNLFMFEAIKVAPNVGFVNAINASSISLVTIFSIILFKDEFSLKKLIGVFGVIGGLLLLLV